MNFRNKKILIVGSTESFTLDKMYFRAFERLGVNVDFLHTQNTLQNSFDIIIKKFLPVIHYFFIRKKLNLFFKKKKNNHFNLIIFFKGIYLKKNILSKLKEKNPKTIIINIFPDDPLNTKLNYISNKNFVKCLPIFDFSCIWSKKILKKLKKIVPSRKLIYLPFGYDEFLHKKVKTNKKYSNIINFIGSYDKKRFEILKNLFHQNILIAGSGWKGKFKNPKNIYNPFFGKKLCEAISSSNISINLLRDQNEGSHNMKTFEIPAMNGLMLTKRSREQNYFFPENKACLMFSDKKELKEKIEFISKNKSKVKKIRNFAHIISKKNSYRIRAKYLLKKIFYQTKK